MSKIWGGMKDREPARFMGATHYRAINPDGRLDCFAIIFLMLDGSHTYTKKKTVTKCAYRP